MRKGSYSFPSTSSGDVLSEEAACFATSSMSQIQGDKPCSFWSVHRLHQASVLGIDSFDASDSMLEVWPLSCLEVCMGSGDKRLRLQVLSPTREHHWQERGDNQTTADPNQSKKALAQSIEGTTLWKFKIKILWSRSSALGIILRRPVGATVSQIAQC